jgi:hypothetical protein
VVQASTENLFAISGAKTPRKSPAGLSAPQDVRDVADVETMKRRSILMMKLIAGAIVIVISSSNLLAVPVNGASIIGVV